MTDYELHSLDVSYKQLERRISQDLTQRNHWKWQKMFWIVAGFTAVIAVIVSNAHTFFPALAEFGRIVEWW